MNRAEKSQSNPNQVQERKMHRTLSRLYKVFGPYYKKYWKVVAVAYTALFMTVLIGLLLPWPLKLILDNVVLNHPWPEQAALLGAWAGQDKEWMLAVLVVGFMILRVSEGLFSFLHKVGIMSIGERIGADVRNYIFAHIQKLPLSFHDSTRSGDLVYRLTSDIEDIKVLLVQVPQIVVYRLVTIVAYVGLMLVLEWRLALVACAVVPMLYYVHWCIGGKVQKANINKKAKESDISSIISENVTAMALVQAYGREDLQHGRFKAENRQSLDFGLTALQLTKTFRRCNDLLLATGTGAVVYYGGVLALEGSILPGTLVLFVAYLKNLYKPFESIAALLLTVSNSQVAGERLLELVESDVSIQEDPQAIVAPEIKGRIEYHDVGFSYQKGIDVLKDVSFVIEPGQVVALVGPSGSGKSTLISLLLRLYDPEKGRIFIDGYDLHKLAIRSLRNEISVVMQEARLLNKTVRENIRFGRESATDEEIIHAAKLAQAHEFIGQMSEGYDTEISEGGRNLSGGQRQRINIARAIIRNTPIVILDEPGTALDVKTEANLHNALHELMRGKTTIIIAHRLTTIIEADKILLLEKGELAASGTHQELMETSQTYRELYALQFEFQGEIGMVMANEQQG